MKTSSILKKANIVILALILRCFADASDESDYVTCGSAVKLSHVEKSGKEYYLSSGGHRINAGSGQQLVTASPDKGGVSSLWLIREGHGMDPCASGDKIPFGSKIRLTHVETGGNLHSHLVRSPLSNQQEITAFGQEGEGDHGDDWIVNPVTGSDAFWKKDQAVFITHDATQKHLGCSEQAKFSMNNCGRQCPVMDHLEVFGRGTKDALVQWKTTMGVFLHK